jgi:hypothetical protein
VNESLPGYLDSIDPRLREYLDDRNELRLDTVWHLDVCAGALLDGFISRADLAEDWPDWSRLARAFVVCYASEDLRLLESKSAFFAAEEDADQSPLSDNDRLFLEAFRRHLDRYSSGRETE